MSNRCCMGHRRVSAGLTNVSYDSCESSTTPGIRYYRIDIRYGTADKTVIVRPRDDGNCCPATLDPDAITKRQRRCGGKTNCILKTLNVGMVQSNRVAYLVTDSDTSFTSSCFPDNYATEYSHCVDICSSLPEQIDTYFASTNHWMNNRVIPRPDAISFYLHSGLVEIRKIANDADILKIHMAQSSCSKRNRGAFICLKVNPHVTKYESFIGRSISRKDCRLSACILQNSISP